MSGTEAVDATAAAMSEGSDAGSANMVDLRDVDENASFPVIPRGTYPALIDDLTFGPSSKGNPMWTVVLEISEGEQQGRKLFYHLPFMKDMMPRVKKFLVRIGAGDLANSPFNPEEVANQGILVGKACQVRVDIRKYEGQDRNNVKDVLPPSDGSVGASFLDSTS